MIFNVLNVKIIKISNMGTPSRIPSPKRSNLAHLSHCPAICFSKVATLGPFGQTQSAVAI